MALDINGYNAVFKSFADFAQQRVNANDAKAVVDAHVNRLDGRRILAITQSLTDEVHKWTRTNDGDPRRDRLPDRPDHRIEPRRARPALSPVEQLPLRNWSMTQAAQRNTGHSVGFAGPVWPNSQKIGREIGLAILPAKLANRIANRQSKGSRTPSVAVGGALPQPKASRR